MTRIPLIVGNWKMHKTATEARAFVTALNPLITATGRSILLAVPYTAIEAAATAAKGTGIRIGAQNMHDHAEGAYTGEISARMLRESGASFVILGHSERRQYFAETDAFIRRKVHRSLSEGLAPILCIGELSHQRDSGDYGKVLQVQLEESLQGITSGQASQVIIAYEPIWAIGTGKTATPEMAQEVHHFIRRWFEERFGKEPCEKLRVLYGGSVKPDNISRLMAQPDVDGVLVGGASLEAETFAQIVNYGKTGE